MRDGVWNGRGLLPESWVDHGRRFRSVDEADGRRYGAHWWVTDDDLGTWWASGYPDGSPALFDWRKRLVAAFRDE